MKIKSTGFDGILLAILSIALLVLLFFGGTHTQSDPTPATSMEMEGTIQTTTTTSSTTTTTVAAQPLVLPAPKVTIPNESRWDLLAQCECGGNYGCNTGNGFGGAFQFMHQASYSSWRAYGGEQFSEHPWDASREQQIVVAERIYNSVGWSAWPACSRKLGFR